MHSLFQQQEKARQEQARKAMEQQRQNEATRAMIQAQNAPRSTSYLNFINTNQSPNNYNHQIQQSLSYNGPKR